MIRYSEGLEIGYRWFQAQGIEPLFGFGFGLSYTTFDIDPAATNHPFGVWDYCTQAFVAKPGEYTFYVGNSAANTPHATTVTVP